MKQENVVVLTSTSTKGFLYNVYKKDDEERKTPLYMGQISDDPKFNQCTCTGFSLLSKCYHQTKARLICEVKMI